MAPKRALILACGALARELRAVVGPDDNRITIECLPGDLHNRPDLLPGTIEARLDAVADRFDTILLGYADCGTGGRIDEICERRGVERLPGPHCYASYAGQDRFAELHEQELGTLYLTDYLAKHFDLLLWRPLGLDDHPELLDLYFGNYHRVVHLAQTADATIRCSAKKAADRLGLAFEYHETGYGELGDVVVELGRQLDRPDVGTGAAV
jgi:hypothetical protein